jgi:uncharacterized membrane protein YphA (DoxX/SURF4 family)
MDQRMTTVFWTLRIGLGAAAFLAGCDKFFNILADWEAHLSPLVAGVLPISAASFMHIVGVIEIVVGLAVLGGVTRLGGYVMMAWLLGIAVNLVTTGTFFDVAVRDVEIALAAFALAQLSEVRAEAAMKVRHPNPAARAAAAA